MNRKCFSFSFVLSISVLLAKASLAGSVPEGSYKGSAPSVKGPDVLALLVKKDRAVLAEYDRLKYIPGPERLEITRWVPRMYAYRIEDLGGNRYALKPLRVSETGELVDANTAPDILTLANAGTMDGATLERHDGNSSAVAETIKFKGRVGSTWEGYVPGTYFGSKDSTGGDYFKKDINMTLAPDKVADFFQKDIVGKYDLSEKAPGMYTLTAKSLGNLGDDKVVTRIAVFVDIVNWKPIFTTDEFLLINPDDPRDVGFYYERH